MIPKTDWKWFGHAGHFICAQWCRFHLCTQVGAYLISTIGEYVPDDGVREILASQRKIILQGRGDARLADYMSKIGFERLGAGPHCYETLVFRAGKPCNRKECGCGLPFPSDYSEIAGSRWLTPKEAREGHNKFCQQFARKKQEKTTNEQRNPGS